MGLQEHLLKVVDKILVDFFPRLLVEGRHGTSALGIPLLIWGRFSLHLFLFYVQIGKAVVNT